MSATETPPSDVPAVLIVEDDPDLLQAMGFSFEAEGFAVSTFGSGEALLSETALPAHACLVLDEELPGKHGLEVLRILRARGVNLPAVLITTATAAMVSQAQRAGVPLVEKPLMADALLAEVQHQMRTVDPAQSRFHARP